MPNILSPSAAQLLKRAQLENSMLTDLFIQFLELQEVWSLRTDKPRVVSAGIYNAGKSSLFNSIAGMEAFHTGDVPTTEVKQELEQDNYILVDTPGINANATDDEEAEKAFLGADVIVFTSNILRGGLDAIEVEFLKRIQSFYGRVNDFAESILFVLTNCNQVENEMKSTVLSKVRQQLADHLGIMDARLFIADSVTYFEALALQNEELIALSGLEEVREAVATTAAKVRENSGSRVLERIRLIADQMDTELVKLRKPVLDKRQHTLDRIREIEKNLGDLTALRDSITLRLNDMLSKKLMMRTSAYEPYPRLNYVTPSSDYKYKSDSEAERAGRDKFTDSIYSKRESCAKRMLWDMKDVYGPYLVYEMREGNAYYEANTLVARFVQEVISKLNALGLYDESIPASWANFQIVPKISSEAASYLNGYEVMSDMLPGGEYYASSWYTKYIDTDYREYESKKGWFDDGYRYKYDIYSAVKDFENDLRSHGKDASGTVWGYLSSGVNNFIQQVENELTSRIGKLSAIIQEEEREKTERIMQLKRELGEQEKELSDMEQLRSIWTLR